MAKIYAEGVVIDSTEFHWRVFEDSPSMITRSAMFEALRGDSVVSYSADFGNEAGLPGSVLSVSYIQAVLVGFHDKSQRWLLGIHLAQHQEDAPIFKRLVQWQPGTSQDHANEVREAAQSLALILACPLKVFGGKKLPSQPFDPNRTGITGPLEPHDRTRIEKEDVQRRAKRIDLPIDGDGYNLSRGRSGLVLKLSKSVKDSKVETPVFNLCDINTEDRLVRLIAPTGLLGMFTRSKGQQIPMGSIFNVEHRYIKAQVTEQIRVPNSDISEAQVTLRHAWGVYLTLKDESVLLLQSVFTQSPELMRTRGTQAAGTGKHQTNSAEGLRYFQEYLKEQEVIDRTAQDTDHIALKIAAEIGCAIIKTVVET